MANSLQNRLSLLRFVPLGAWTRDELRRVMGGLPEQQARAVQLRVADEQPYAKVAAQLGCSEGVARVWVSRALVRLADLIEAP